MTSIIVPFFCAIRINCKYSPLPPGEERSGLEHSAAVLGGGGGIAAQIVTRYSNLTDVIWNNQSKVILNNRIVP